MKKLSLIFLAAASLAACNSGSDADKATTAEEKAVANADGTSYQVDPASTVVWTGYKPTGKHDGSFAVSNGSLVVNQGGLEGGSFTIDINSLQNIDLENDAENKTKLEGHLKSPDFFDVAKFPTASFAITSVEPYTAGNDNSVKLPDATHLIIGNLTLKDSTKNISFPAKVTLADNKLTANADFVIDRTQWGMKYKGPNNPQDWFINKDVNIKLNIVSSKK